MAKYEIPADTPFEKALSELETLLREMESGQKPLEELIECFERGTALSSFCRNKLDALEKRVEILVADNGEKGEWRKFAETTAPERSPRM